MRVFDGHISAFMHDCAPAETLRGRPQILLSPILVPLLFEIIKSISKAPFLQAPFAPFILFQLELGAPDVLPPQIRGIAVPRLADAARHVHPVTRRCGGHKRGIATADTQEF